MVAKHKPWKTLATKIVHTNPWYKVRHDKFTLPKGKIGNYYFIDFKASVFIIPIEKNSIILEKIYRYPLKKWFLELPGGGSREQKSVLETAKSELKEELGYIGKFKKIGQFVPYNGVSKETCYVFQATDLKFVGCHREETEILKEVRLPIKKVYRMLDEGKFSDGMTMAALALARKYLVKNYL